jgi:L-lactate dehydrogenase complex protein LldG
VNSREVVLGRIRAALAADTEPPPPVPRGYIRVGANLPGSEPVLELMIDRLVDYKAQVREVAPADLAAAIDEALGAQRSVVVARDLDADLVEAAGRGDRTVTVDGDPDLLAPARLDEIDAVVSTARVAIALSGTIVLDGGPGQGRRAITLVPDFHVVVLHANQVVQTVPEAIARLDPVRPLTMIAGPSATSDIELERVEGVHGPRTLSVLIVGPSTSAEPQP